jgi:hypothetical protein
MCAAAVRTAAPFPWFTSWKRKVQALSPVAGSDARSSSSTCRVPSVEQSSTMMISFRMGTAMTRSSSRRTVPTSL